jgi:hypothetical protein
MQQPVLARLVHQLDCASFDGDLAADVAAADHRLAQAQRRWPGLAQPSAYLAFVRRMVDGRGEAMAASA